MHAAAAAIDGYLLPPGLQQQTCSSGFAAVDTCWDRRADRRTDTAPCVIDTVPHTTRANALMVSWANSSPFKGCRIVELDY